VKCFEKFRTGIRKTDASGEADDSSDASNGALDLESEINLLEKIKDIRDELNILQSICDVQKSLMQKLFSLIAKPNRFQEQEIARDPLLNYYQERSNIDLRLEKINKMQTDSIITYDSVGIQIQSFHSSIYLIKTAQSPLGPQAKEFEYFRGKTSTVAGSIDKQAGKDYPRIHDRYNYIRKHPFMQSKWREIA
jgi:hypothetical protein